jgi:hypothetical protein
VGFVLRGNFPGGRAGFFSPYFVFLDQILNP